MNTGFSNETAQAPFGPYELISKLAHGGMAEIFLGRQIGSSPDEKPIVIKRILPELCRDRWFLAMFINEAQLAAQMNHPNVVKIHGFGEMDGQAYMVMEYVEGLDCWRFSRRLFPWGEDHEAIAIRIIIECLTGLEYVHRLKDVNGIPMAVVHRDFSPSNIYLSVDGNVKIGDFGIAQIDSDRYRPIKFIAKGKFGYMAPEQVEGSKVDRRSDVYSAGVVLSELLIGRKLFSGNSRLSVMLNIRDGRTEVLDNNAERISGGVMEILRGALAKKPSDRYQSAVQFADRLSEFLVSTGREVSPEDLGKLVRRAVDLRDQKSSTPDSMRERTPITANELVTETILDARTDGLDLTNRFAGLEVEPPEELDGTPITTESESFRSEGRYLARIAEGLTIGPTSYAHIIELIYSDRIGPQTEISVDGHQFHPSNDFPELARHLPVYTPTCDVNDVATPDRRGFLEMEVPTEVLLTLAARRESGLFVCQNGQRRKEVYLVDGNPIYVGSNDSKELLGEFLVEKGVIDRMELEMALALLPKFNGHMGDTLIALGMLTAVGLFGHIKDQVLSRLEELMGWREGNYEYYRGAECRSGVLELSINPFRFVKEKVLRDVQDINAAMVLDEMGSCLVAPTPIMPELIDRLNFPTEIAEKIRSVSDWLTVRELATAAGKSQIVLARALYVALETGLWAFDGRVPPWRRIKEQTSE